MLNIPSEVKALFKADSVFKNFHVHFPNGETTDLNNDNIVSESVEFTESLCSQQSFRFGLTEASEIQFTAVGIPNVRGATIECAIEIQVDDLGAEWLAEHAPTGTEDFLDPQVCTYGGRNMYRVPYGRFIVDKCPRNHEGMWKREVTAYTERTESDTLNPYITALMNTYHFGKAQQTWSPMVMPLVLSLVANNSNCETILAEYGYEQITVGVGTSQSLTTVSLKGSAGNSISIAFRKYNTYYNIANLTSKNLLATTSNLEPNSNDYVKEQVIEALTARGVDAEKSGYASMADVAEYCLQRAGLLKGEIDVSLPETTGFGTSVRAKCSTRVIYPRFNDAWNSVTVLPYFSVKKTGDGEEETFIDLIKNWDANAIKIWDLTDTTNPFYNASFSINSTLNYYDRTTSQQRYAFTNAISLADVLQGFLELTCKFGSPSRTGGFEITTFDSTDPVSIPPSDYAELWYDETTIAPIGTVKIKFKDSTGDQETVITIGDGLSVYDMTNNAILENVVITLTDAEITANKTIVDKVTEMLNAVFVPNIPDLTFIPIELTKKGLPYLEAGDAVTITTGDGQTVPSFILRQTIKGIQFLQADVESANGEAVELIES